MVLGNFQCRAVLLIWIRVGQRPTALAVGAGGVVWTFFLSSIMSFLSPSLWKTARYGLKYCHKGSFCIKFDASSVFTSYNMICKYNL